MALICKGKCDHEKLLNPTKYLKHLNQKRFMRGWKWCKLCRIGFKTDKLYCFCCGLKMRMRIRTRAVFEDKLPEQRICAVCDGTKTYTNQRGYQTWKCYGDAFICTTCYHYIKYHTNWVLESMEVTAC